MRQRLITDSMFVHVPGAKRVVSNFLRGPAGSSTPLNWSQGHPGGSWPLSAARCHWLRPCISPSRFVPLSLSRLPMCSPRRTAGGATVMSTISNERAAEFAIRSPTPCPPLRPLRPPPSAIASPSPTLVFPLDFCLPSFHTTPPSYLPVRCAVLDE